MIIDEIAQPDRALRRPLLDRRIELGRIKLELIAYVLLFVASIVIHLWQLGYMAMAHDESIHAWMSWKFFTGRGDFQCAGQRSHATYCYDPVYHGPTLYFATLISYFLFGISDATARLPQALSGIALIPACYLLRPLLGKRATLLAAILVTLSPSILYFSRYARHDALILLWTLLMAAGLFRWLREGRTSSLMLAAAGLALAWATHELVFILIFIFVSFLMFRLFWEWRPRLFVLLLVAGLNVALLVALGTAATTAGSQIHIYLQRLLGPAMLAGAGATMSLLLARAWPREPIIINRLRTTWATRANADPARPRTLKGVLPPALWAALCTFLVIFGLLFSTFLAWPRGFLDGFYQGIAYWWFSQHEAARGGQPWYYYLMLLPIYELMALIFAIGATVALSLRRGRLLAEAPARTDRPDSRDGNGTYIADTTELENEQPAVRHRVAIYEIPSEASANVLPVDAVPVEPSGKVTPDLFVSFLAYWWVLSLIAFSWAGEKMPWLLIHTALPVTLLAAWALSELIGGVPWRAAWHERGWAVPPLIVSALVFAGVGIYYLSGAGATVAALQDRLRALPALALMGATIFGLMTVAGKLSTRVVLRLAALTVAGLLLLYGVRAAVQVVYLHPDTPIEPLIYTQTAPDVPIIVDEIRRTAISQTRNERSPEDPVGGLSMKVVADPELAWPFQWYLRDFKSVCWIDFEAKNCMDWDAPVVLLHEPSITPEIRETLEETHVRVSEGVLNWWFPESGSTDVNGVPVRGYKELAKDGPLGVLSWPFRPSNWPLLARFMVYREVPQKLEGREMQVYMQREIAPVAGGGSAAAGGAVVNEPLVTAATFGAGQLGGPRGITVDPQGNLLVADSFNHRIAVFDAAGGLVRTIGAFGSGEGQLNEPSGVAVDEAGNVYVADTWNARIAKFGPDGQWITSWGTGRDDLGDGRRATDTTGSAQGNLDNPLGFYGPRNVLVIDERVYIADTGNKRVVVTDLDGTYVDQFGSFGSQSGEFSEPIGLGTDPQGRIYVGDTWNSRIQVFSRDQDGSINAKPDKLVSVSGWEKNTYNDPYMAVTSDGRMLVSLAARNAVGVYGATGTLEHRLRGESDQFDGPKGLAVGPDGSAYVVDGTGAKVVRFNLP